MTPEAQRIAIAEWCGTAGALGYVTDINIALPDYLGDLNAIHEAERGMSNEMCDRFECFLQKILTDEELKWVVGQKNRIESASRYRWHATAAQRSEALLKTIGRWTEELEPKDKAE